MQTLKFIYEAGNTPKSQLDIKKAVFAFGRFNPPTKGHKKLLDKVKSIAGSNDFFVFPSNVKDTKMNPTKNKNPLDIDTKLRFLKRLFPEINFVRSNVRTPFEAFEWLVEHGYGDITFVVGSDRVDEFTKRMKPFADKYINNFTIVNAGTRDPDATDAAGMSGTKAREAALANDIGKFRAATGWSGEIVHQLMDAVKNGLGV